MGSTGVSKRAAALTLIALFVFSGIPHVYAHRHHHHQSARRLIDVSNHSLGTACDLDADVRPDLVTLHANGYDKTIAIRFGDARGSQLSFTTRSEAQGNLLAGDIDHDGDVDLVWVGAVNPQSAVVLINDGEGNLAEAADYSPYASELDGLFGSSPSDNRTVKRGRKSSTLTTASLHEVGLPLLIRFPSITISLASESILEPPSVQSLYVRYVRKRGPPVILS